MRSGCATANVVAGYCDKCEWCQATRTKWIADITEGMRAAGRIAETAFPMLNSMPLISLEDVHAMWTQPLFVA